MPKSKRKPVKFELIEQYEDRRTRLLAEPYRTMQGVADANHPHLKEARIALAWRKDWTADRDGHVVLGKCKKASDLDRELTPWDFVILLNADVWPDLTDAQREAILDHELCHAAVVYGDDGRPKRDERGRVCYRVRKHDVEEFYEVVKRHGTFKRDLEEFAKVLLERKATPLFGDEDGPVAGQVG